jgi:thiol-disulfide isomerase/thioredoxin
MIRALTITIVLLLTGSLWATPEEGAKAWTELLRFYRDKSLRILPDLLSPREASAALPYNSKTYWEWAARYRLEFRNRGLQLWKTYPDSDERFIWLSRTMDLQVPYWINASVGAALMATGADESPVTDYEKLLEWERQYAVMRADLMARPSAVRFADQRAGILQHELLGQLEHWQRSTLSAAHRALRGVRLATDIAAFAGEQSENDNGNVNGLPLAVTLLDALENDRESERMFLEICRLSTNASLRWLAAGRDRLYRFREQPLDLKLKSLDGTSIDFAQLRGNVILVDFWGNWCISCVEAFPKLNALQKTFRDRPFKVVGIWMSAGRFAPGYQDNAEEALNREKVRACSMLQANHVSWPTGVLEGEAVERFERDYALHGVPTLWLLDADGKLVTANPNRLKRGSLEDEIRNLLLAMPSTNPPAD